MKVFLLSRKICGSVSYELKVNTYDMPLLRVQVCNLEPAESPLQYRKIEENACVVRIFLRKISPWNTQI